MADIELLLEETQESMDSAIEAMKRAFAGIRTGKASPALVENIDVEAYGAQMKLKQLALITTPEARLLVIQPFDVSTVQAIEKAIKESKIGINPNVDGKIIRLPIPALTEERRRDLVKLVHRLAEDGKVAVRNVRRDCMKDLKELVHEGELGEDVERRAETELQKYTDEHVRQLDELFKHKEAEILEV